MQYLYTDDHHAYFMDLDTYEQHPIDESLLTEQKAFLKENTVCDVLVHGGGVLGIELPNFIEARIVETDPGVRGDTASGGTKPATLETGAVVQVPLFVNKGEVIRVDTRTSAYLERVS
jgi:elongation factor P